jgi:hypothetical protein
LSKRSEMARLPLVCLHPSTGLSRMGCGIAAHGIGATRVWCGRRCRARQPQPELVVEQVNGRNECAITSPPPFVKRSERRPAFQRKRTAKFALLETGGLDRLFGRFVMRFVTAIERRGSGARRICSSACSVISFGRCIRGGGVRPARGRDRNRLSRMGGLMDELCGSY